MFWYFISFDSEWLLRVSLEGDKKSFKMQDRFSSLEGRSRPLLTLARSITPGYDVLVSDASHFFRDAPFRVLFIYSFVNSCHLCLYIIRKTCYYLRAFDTVRTKQWWIIVFKIRSKNICIYFFNSFGCRLIYNNNLFLY